MSGLQRIRHAVTDLPRGRQRQWAAAGDGYDGWLVGEGDDDNGQLVGGENGGCSVRR